MSLIKVLEYGYNTDGVTLYLKIALPKGAYLGNFHICNQKNISYDGNTKIISPFEVLLGKDPANTALEVFNTMFKHINDYTDVSTNENYSVFELNSNFTWYYDSEHQGRGIEVSKDNLTFITMTLQLSSVDASYIKSSECGCDNTVRTIVLYDDLKVKLDTLSYAKGCIKSCEDLTEFISKILELKALELAVATGEYYKAAKYWHKFYYIKDNSIIKKCRCNG